ncbi:sensor histidine kinase, partial [Roseateles oligotrophus]
NLKVIWSAQTYAIFDLDPDKFQASHSAFLEFVDPLDRAKVDAAFSNSFENSAINSVEHRIVTAKGLSKQVEERWRIERDDQGTPLRAVGTCQDISERKQAEHELETSRALIDSIIDGSPSAIFALDIEGRFLFVNRMFEQIFGVHRSALLGKTRSEGLGGLMPADIAEEHFKNDQAVVASGLPYEVEERNEEADGTHFYATQKHALRDAVGRVFGVAGSSLDITARKRIDQALLSALGEKEALLKEVHHRVKNNLQVIASLLRMESRRSTVPEAIDVLKAMQGRILVMAQLHESLYRTGTFAAVDLGAYLGQVATQSFQAQRPAGNQLQLKLDMGSVPVGMDQSIACALLLNELISNCLKHGFPDGRSGEVRVALQPAGPALDRSDNLWCLRVSDTGVGLSPDFEDRRQASLGMQLAEDLSRQVGGRLEIQSETGAGADFSVLFEALAPVRLVMPK